MTDLPIKTPRPAPRETLYSYIARVAAVWKTSAPVLAKDMGASFKRLHDQDEVALEGLATWAKLDSEEFAELLSWTGTAVGNVRTEFRGEIYMSRALRNPIVRGCPICLREDAKNAGNSGSAAMIMRGHWQMRAANLCIKHTHPLVILWTTTAPRERYDIGARLVEIETQILNGSLDQPTQSVTAYDIWLDRRVAESADETWLKNLSVFAVTTFCRRLGEILLSSEENHSIQRVVEPHSLGFDIVVQGKDAICTALDEIAGRAFSEKTLPRTTFGKLFEYLDEPHIDGPDLDLFRDLLRECILNHWPVATGENLLGKVILERRHHSLASAMQETGISSSILRTFLSEAGAIDDKSIRSDYRQMFSAKDYSEILAEIPTLVASKDMRHAMGVTKQEFAALIEEGLISPRTRSSHIRKPWRISDGTELCTELSSGAVSVSNNDSQWETLLNASRRRGLSLADAITVLKNGSLKVGQREGVKGFHGIVVLKSELDSLTTAGRASQNEALKEFAQTMSVIKFIKSIGLRDSKSFLSFIKAGHATASIMINPRTSRKHYRMNEEDMAAFHRRFVTLTTLEAETGIHKNTLRQILKPPRLSPFAPKGKNYGPIYLRPEAMALICKTGTTSM